MCPKCRAGTANDLQWSGQNGGGGGGFPLRAVEIGVRSGERGERDFSFDSWLNNLVFQNNLGRWSIVVRLLSIAAVWIVALPAACRLLPLRCFG